jgi:hypothetical protein
VIAVIMAAAFAAPRHVTTFLYYGQSFGSVAVNARLSPAFMAAHADFIESSGFDHHYVDAFKAAGGRFAGTYVDPTYVPYCVPPFAAPAGRCNGQIGSENPPESAWFHDASGARVHRRDAYTGQYQEFLDPASLQARLAVARWMSDYVAQSPKLDFFFADDSGSTLLGPQGTAQSGMFYGFNAVGTEVTTGAAWSQGENALFAAAPRRLVINGGDGFRPAYGGTFLLNSGVAGSNLEGCFDAAGSGPVGDEHGEWTAQADGLLAAIPFRKYSLCMMNGPPSPANRLYALASWWLTYDARYSVAAPIAPDSDGNTIFPEFELVPAQPATTAIAGNIETLRRDGLYVREFGQCYAKGRPIGGCAAVVNPTNAPLRLPTGLRRYPYALELAGGGTLSGGRTLWVRTEKRPQHTGTVGPLRAVILKQ